MDVKEMEAILLAESEALKEEFMNAALSIPQDPWYVRIQPLLITSLFVGFVIGFSGLFTFITILLSDGLKSSEGTTSVLFFFAIVLWWLFWVSFFWKSTRSKKVEE